MLLINPTLAVIFPAAVIAEYPSCIVKYTISFFCDICLCRFFQKMLFFESCFSEKIFLSLTNFFFCKRSCLDVLNCFSDVWALPLDFTWNMLMIFWLMIESSKPFKIWIYMDLLHILSVGSIHLLHSAL